MPVPLPSPLCLPQPYDKTSHHIFDSPVHGHKNTDDNIRLPRDDAFPVLLQGCSPPPLHNAPERVVLLPVLLQAHVDISSSGTASLLQSTSDSSFFRPEDISLLLPDGSL